MTTKIAFEKDEKLFRWEPVIIQKSWVLTIYMEKTEIPVWKLNGSRCSVWEENMGPK